MEASPSIEWKKVLQGDKEELVLGKVLKESPPTLRRFWKVPDFTSHPNSPEILQFLLEPSRLCQNVQGHARIFRKIKGTYKGMNYEGIFQVSLETSRTLALELFLSRKFICSLEIGNGSSL